MAHHAKDVTVVTFRYGNHFRQSRVDQPLDWSSMGAYNQAKGVPNVKRRWKASNP